MYEKMFVKIKESVEEKLRKLCSGLSPEKRVPAIVVLAALFAIGNFYMISVPSMTSDGRMYGRKS